MKVVLRRAAGATAATDDVLAYGALRLDPAAHEVRVGDALVDLTATEFKLLHVLLELRGRVIGRGELIEQVRDDAYHVTERTVDTHVKRIRAKLRPFGLDPIETVHGVGYKVPR